ncbi:hypothetical protein C2G38_2224702 [Gigaspora rosea]|uniref:Uncharacterized protein n=1 Tax=Gigaspora rosea TaxID=44941 RepID=A0A397U1N0_9GLOM|nr:hypothetical protein C2G38_2224702 [Gigaspora rosea]
MYPTDRQETVTRTQIYFSKHLLLDLCFGKTILEFFFEKTLSPNKQERKKKSELRLQETQNSRSTRLQEIKVGTGFNNSGLSPEFCDILEEGC